MKKDFIITKNNIECYKIRHSSATPWADINVDTHGKSGRLSIASDYGNWSYYWGACGEPFKQFLEGLDKHYVARKFGCAHTLDMERTIQTIKREVVCSVRSGSTHVNTARVIWTELEYPFRIQEHDFFNNLERYCPALMQTFNYDPPICYGISPLFLLFWDEIWRVFLDTLRAERLSKIANI